MSRVSATRPLENLLRWVLVRHRWGRAQDAATLCRRAPSRSPGHAGTLPPEEIAGAGEDRRINVTGRALRPPVANGTGMKGPPPARDHVPGVKLTSSPEDGFLLEVPLGLVRNVTVVPNSGE